MKLRVKLLIVSFALGLSGCGLVDPLYERAVRNKLEQRTNAVEAADYRRAFDLAEDALALARRNLGVEHPLTATSLLAAAESHERVFDLGTAEKYYGLGLELRQLTLGNEHPDTLKSMQQLTRFYYQSRRRLEKAEPLAEETLALRTKILGKSHRDTIESMVDLANIANLRHRPDRAEPMYLRAVELSKEVLGDDDRDTLQWMRELGFFYYGRGQYEEAERVYVETTKGGMSSLGVTHPAMIGFHEELANVYQGQGRLAEASKLRRQILDWKRAAKSPS